MKDKAVRTVSRLGSWTLLVVLANQLSLFVVLAFAFGIGGDGPVSAYTYGWSFMQMPYAVVVVSVLGVLTPQLAGFATAEDFAGLSERLRFGLRQSLVIIIPCTLVLLVLAQPLVAILLNHVNGRTHLAAGTVLAVLAAGLPGFTVFQLCVRGLQSMQRAREVFLSLRARQRAHHRVVRRHRSPLDRRAHRERLDRLHRRRGRGARRARTPPREHHHRRLERARASQPLGVARRDCSSSPWSTPYRAGTRGRLARGALLEPRSSPASSRTASSSCSCVTGFDGARTKNARLAQF